MEKIKPNAALLIRNIALRDRSLPNTAGYSRVTMRSLDLLEKTVPVVFQVRETHQVGVCNQHLTQLQDGSPDEHPLTGRGYLVRIKTIVELTRGYSHAFLAGLRRGHSTYGLCTCK